MNREEKLEKLVKLLRQAFGDAEGLKSSGPFEMLILAILAFEDGLEAAKRASAALLAEFVDWNEVRVSSWKEIGAILEKERISSPGDKAIALKRSLEAVFTETNRMDLDAVSKMPQEKAVNLLLKLKDMDEGSLAALLYLHVGLQTLAPTQRLLRVAQRIGFIQESAMPSSMKQNLSSFVGQRNAFRFHYLLGKLGEKYCFEKAAFCGKCPALPYCHRGAACAPWPADDGNESKA